MLLDEFLIKLVLKDEVSAKSATVSKTLKGLEEQGGKTSAGVEKLGKTAKATTASMGDLARGVASFLAVIGGTVAIKSFVSDMIDSSAALDRFSKNLGLSASEVTAWGNSVEELGGSAKGLQGSLATLSKAQTDLTMTGDSQLLPYFSLMGVAIADAGGHARKTTDILKDMAGYAEGKDRTTMHNMFGSMGLDEGTINLLLQGRNELELNLKRQKEYGDQIAKFSPEATKMQRALVDLKQQFTLLGLGLLQQATPALEKILGVFQRVGSWLQEHKAFVLDFFKAFAAGIAIVGTALGVAQLEDAPILLVIGAVAGLAAGIALLYDDYKTWEAGGKSLINWAQWKSEIDAAKAGMEELRKVATTAFDVIVTAARVSWDAIHGNWGALKNDLASGTKAGAKALGVSTGLDETHDQNAAKVDAFFRRIPAMAQSFWGGGTSPWANNKPQSISDQAKAQAQRVSKMTGIPADILWAQWAHETGNFSNRGAKELNNLAGVNVPGGHGQDYRKFKSMDEFGDYYAHLMRPSGYYPNASKAKNTDDFAAALKAGGYYSDTQAHYAAGLRKYDNQYLQGTPGAANALRGGSGTYLGQIQSAGSRGGPSSTSNDSSTTVTTTIATLNINAPTGNGHDIANAFSRGMNPIFTSYANGGMN
jgi:hypothetical protein